MAKLPWRPWHEVVRLREDLRSGELSLSMFAADLYEVMMQKGKRPVYEKPGHFFALTYPTYNLRKLARDVVLRLAGKNDKAVRQLELTYGGGKTHTLITLRHLVHDPDKLPDLPAVHEFIQEIGQPAPKCRIASLCFDKLDVEKGMEIVDPDGRTRVLKQPWSVLAYQVAGDEGLKLLHADGKAEERDTAPAENLLIELLQIPIKQNLGILILIDEVLMYVREKIAQDSNWRSKLINFFQYLTQAATKVDRCCIVASLLATDPLKSDTFGRELQGELYDIFQRQREEAVTPVVKEDVAEVLRRRFFTPESLKEKGDFRQHVVAALKGITAIDEQTAKQGADAEEKYLKSFPFHPDLTDVFYEKWTNLDRFQKTRGILRTFALALREAEKWDASPLIGAEVFLSAPGVSTLSEAASELVTVADTEEWEGHKQAWTGILESEFSRAKEIDKDSIGLEFREIEQAVMATFLHSQPIGKSAGTRDLIVLLGSTRPDKIDLEKGLMRWAQQSHWLDDQYTAVSERRLPDTWRLGNKPNLNQMHAIASSNIADDFVHARLLDEIVKVKGLSANASAAGVRVHTMPTKPKDIEDDGVFHYAILSPDAASESGKPGSFAKQFLDETTGSDKPRVYRNSVILLTPSKDGVELALSRVRDFLAWEIVRNDIRKQQKDGNVEPARAQILQINIEKARGRIPEAIKHAYCIVVTVSGKNEDHAFRITITEESHFNIIKEDSRSRVQDTAISSEALLPDGPYNLWRPGETSRRVKDLAGAFAQLPHLPKMLKTKAILDTLAEGCARGTFVLRIVRPDGTSRTWWMSRPDDNALSDSAMELVLPNAAELSELSAELLAPGKLPGLWPGDDITAGHEITVRNESTVRHEITVRQLEEYFSGSTIVQIDKGGYREPLTIPKISSPVLEKTIDKAVEDAVLWLISGPASILGEHIPAGVLNASAKLLAPPEAVGAPEILPENLPAAWKEGACSGLSVATALSMKAGETLPWKTVKDVIDGALQARFLEIEPGSWTWPCDFSSARYAKFRVPEKFEGPTPPLKANVLVAKSELEAAQIQELGDIMSDLLNIKTKSKIPLKFLVRIEIGDGKTVPPDVIKEINNLLSDVKEGFILE
ncbi:MAG: ATP-binding protein [Nitrospirae bacterium]|nr:ATP-binding protein [Nitrospirota bacterium]